MSISTISSYLNPVAYAKAFKEDIDLTKSMFEQNVPGAFKWILAAKVAFKAIALIAASLAIGFAVAQVFPVAVTVLGVVAILSVIGALIATVALTAKPGQFSLRSNRQYQPVTYTAVQTAADERN